jgi:hypothetical protein
MYASAQYINIISINQKLFVPINFKTFWFTWTILMACRSQWPRDLSRGSTAARLLGLWVRIPLGSWMSVCIECCVLSGRGLCDGLIREALPTVMRRCVWSRNLKNEEAMGRSATGGKTLMAYSKVKLKKMRVFPSAEVMGYLWMFRTPNN